MNSAEAEKLLKQAESRLTTNFLVEWFSATNKFDEAIDLFTRAANLYKMDKEFERAGKCFLRVVDTSLKIDQKHDAASAYINAANCYRQVDLKKSVEILEKGANLYTTMGKFSIAAKTLKDAGEMFEKDSQLEESINCYQKAADFYEGENQMSSANTCLGRVANLSVSLGKYQEAIDTYEKCALMAVEDKLMTYGAKEYLFKSLLCHLAIVSDDFEIDRVKTKVEDYKELDVRFPDTRECQLVEKICNAFDECDVGMFKSAMKGYDSITKLNAWQTNLFLVIKGNLEKQANNVSLQ
eukprot:gene7197-11513_t